MAGTIRSVSLILLFSPVLVLLSPQKLGVGFGFVLGCQNPEREALIRFKQSLSDPENLLSSWKGANCCDWYGVTCDNVTGHVHHVDLQRKSDTTGLTAQNLDPSLVELGDLRYLNLSGNSFNASRIPEFIGSLTQLRYLDLSNAFFSGVVPPHLGNLTRLRLLHLHSNEYLSVQNLDWVPRLSHLQSLNIGNVLVTEAESSIKALSKLPSLLDLQLASCFPGNNSPSLSPSFHNSTWLSTLENLDLSYNYFQGPLPRFLANMTSLRFLDLSNNLFNGSIPFWMTNMGALESISLASNSLSQVNAGTIMGMLGNLCKLRVLDFSNNSLVQGEMVGPYKNSSRCITYNLESLDLSNNMIMSSLPNWLGELKNLRNIYLWGNRFHGQIPSIVGSLTFLEELDLSSNSFNGTIPPLLGGLSSLRTLDLSHNLLSGHIPESLGECKKLEYIDLSSNFLKGVVTNGHFASLSRLDVLDLSSNSLDCNFTSDWEPPFQLRALYMRSCGIQGQLPTWIQKQSNLELLDLSNNKISGKMLDWSSFLLLEDLNLSYNQIEGSISNLSCATVNLDLSHNFLSEILSPPIVFSALDPSSFFHLCQLTTLQSINLQNNLLSSIPDECWIVARKLTMVNLSFNQLRGLIPTSFGRLPALQFLTLSNNFYEGAIPYELAQCGELVVLDVGENNLSGKIPRFGGKNNPNLRILRLRGNQLSGVIPAQLCSLPELQILDLARNNLTGSIPLCIGQLNGMSSDMPFEIPDERYHVQAFKFKGTILPNMTQYPDQVNIKEVLKGNEREYTKTLKYVVNLDLSCNSLEGSIPEDLANLTGLIALNLSYNHLSGRIPNKIGEISQLESLDLSNNNLSGTIPSSISALGFLSYLNLSHNKLHGKIPTGRQLQTLNDPSIYAGNDGLCGGPLPNKCTRDQGQQGKVVQVQEEQEGEDEREKVLFYIVIILGFGTGFWGVIGTLLLKKQWRHTLFRHVEDMMDCLYVQVVVRMNRLRQ